MTKKARSEYLFSARGIEELRRSAAASVLYAFDLDGTLAAIAYEPQLIVVDDATRRALAGLKRLARVAVLTGRAVADAAGHLGFEPHYLVGNHGAEGLPGARLDADSFRTLTADWEGQARACLARLKGQGLMIENKGVSLAVHYRNAVNRQEAREAIAACIKRLKPGPRHVTGKYVENLIPADAPDKGRALQALMEVSDCGRAFYIGDDETDEDVFCLGDERIFSIHVGTGGGTSAHFFLKRQEEVVQFIQTVIRMILEQGRGPAGA